MADQLGWQQVASEALLISLSGNLFCWFMLPVQTWCMRSSTHLSSSFSLLLCLDAGAPVYLYEFVYQAEIHRNNRPSFVRADHADDVGFMFGGCFWNGQIKITGRFSVMCHSGVWMNFFCFLINFSYMKYQKPTGIRVVVNPTRPFYRQHHRGGWKRL